MGIGATRWHVSMFRVMRDTAGVDELVKQVRELRARILFDHGRRPHFQRADGKHVDDQELDFGAWHFIARGEVDGPPLGYVRLSTPENGALFQSRAYLGGAAYEDLLRAENVPAAEVFEHSRLVVEHRARKLGLGVYLNAVAIGAAHALGARAMIGTSGTKDGQDRFHERFGFRSVPGTRRYVEHYTEDVVIMFHRVSDGAGEYRDLVCELRTTFPSLAADSVAGWRNTIGSDRSIPAGLTTFGRADRNRDCWRPVLFQPARSADWAKLSALLDSGEVREVHDTLDSQLAELIGSREPGRVGDADQLRDKKNEQLAGLRSWEYGTWAWYPWSGRLVHVLPREEFRLVRTDRNRGKIERPAQRRLLDRRIGIIGLSVGNSSAVTLALEGVGGAYKLADFDEISLSNLNRLRTGVHDLGVNKAVICARQMYEIDPYLDIEIHPGGLTETNLVR